MRRLFRTAALLLCAAALCSLTACRHARTEERARERLEAYAHAIDHDYREPEKIYPFLCAEFRSAMTKKQFREAFLKERSYPYITPLYIYSPEIAMDADLSGGTATYLQAARLIGMTYTVGFVYENGDYYIRDWEEFLDGSYLDKFEDVPYTLDWYYDTEEIGN